MIYDAETQSIELANIVFSEDNPRQLFPTKTSERGKVPADLAELVESIKQYGVLQPILVRVAPATVAEHYQITRASTPLFEIVSGARRYWAAKEAGLEKIPARLIVGTDQEIFGIRLVENLQRKDLNPVEEAAAYKKLADEFGYSVEEIAKSAAKSVAYVRQRFKLVDLPQAAVEAVREGMLSPAIGLLIARIPDKESRNKAAKAIISGPQHHWGEKKRPMIYQEAARLIEQQFMTLLSQAPFPTDDAALLPEAGACLACPKRTGLQKDLFSDVTKDSCTDLACYDRKKKAHCARTLDQAKEKGLKVLSPDEMKSQMPYGDSLRSNSKYLNLAEQNYRDHKSRTWKAILGKDVPEITVGVKEDGRLVELVLKADAEKIMKDKAPEWAKSQPSSSSSGAANRRRAKILQETSQLAIAAIVEAAAKQTPDLALWRILVEAAANRWGFEVTSRLVKRRGWITAGKRAFDGPRPESIIKKHTAEYKDAQDLAALLVELIAQGGASYAAYSLSHGEQLKDLASYYEVDLKKIEKQVAEARAKKPKTEAKTVDGKKSKPATKGKAHGKMPTPVTVKEMLKLAGKAGA